MTLLQGSCFSGPSALDHDQGPQARHLLPYPRLVRRVDDLGGVLVGLRHLFINRGLTRGAYQDAPVLQLPLEVAALGRPLRSPAAHLAARSVRARAEGLAHRPFRAGQDEGVAAHVSRNQDWLSHRAVTLRWLLVAGTERAGGALAVHQDLAATVLLELRVVVRKVVEHP